MTQVGLLPVSKLNDVCGDRPRISDLHDETLRAEKRNEPASHLSRSTDHERAFAASSRRHRKAVAFLDGERRANQQQDEIFGKLGRERELFRDGSSPHDDVALLTVVSHRQARLMLDRGHR